MARATLPSALKLMFGHEGGYSSATTDKGNYLNGVLVGTKYGVTGQTLALHRGVKSVSAADVRAMTIDEATQIYLKGYWSQSGGDLLPAGLDYMAFDFGVNSGPARAIKALQRTVGVVEDGNAGPATLAAVKNYAGGIRKLILDYCDARMAFLRSLKDPKTGFPVNGRGWTIRVTGVDPKGQYAPQRGVVGNALALAGSDRALAPVPETVITPTEVVPEGGDAKAVPTAPSPWSKPEVLGPTAGTILAAIAPFASGPVLWALAFVIGLAALLGAYYAFRRISRTPV